MIFNSIPWFLVAGFFMCCGCAVAAIVLDRKYRDDRRQPGLDTKARIKERLQLEDAFEQQVKSLSAAFGRHEQELKQLFAVQKRHIRELERALASCAPESWPMPDASEEPGSWLDATDVKPIEVVPDESGSPELAKLKHRLEALRSEQEVVLEREQHELARAQARGASVPPARDSRRSDEPALAQAQLEIEDWKRKCQELAARATVQPASDTAIPDASLLEELARVKALVGDWQSRARELASAKEAEAAELQARLGELQPILERANEHRQEAERWRAEYSALERRAAQAAAAHHDQVAHLQGEVEEFEQRLAEAFAQRDVALGTGRELSGRVAALDRELLTVRDELATARAEAANAARRNDELAAEVATLNQRAAERLDELESQRARQAEAQRAADTQAATLRSELDALGAQSRELQVSVTRWTERCQERERALERAQTTLAERERTLAEISALNHALGQQLAQTGAESEKYRKAMAAQTHQFEVAQALLAELKPVIESLQTELTSDKAAGS